MPNVQWSDIPFALETPEGSGADALAFNPFLDITNPVTHFSRIAGPQWILLPEKCQAGSAKRVARDNTPQKGGEVIHRKFKAGLVIQLGLLAVNVKSAPALPGSVEYEPACDADLVDLFDLLIGHLDSIENADGRLTWAPSGKPARMMDAARWLGPEGGGAGAFTSVLTEIDTVVFTAAQFALLCPFPYAMDAAQTITCVGGPTPNCSGSSSVAVATNNGTTGFYPVLRVYGPSSSFQIVRTSILTGETQSFVYEASLPRASSIPSGEFIELDFFRETAYFNGSGANAKPGIDVLNSDFWALEKGDNILAITGATADVFWQPAWAG